MPIVGRRLHDRTPSVGGEHRRLVVDSVATNKMRRFSSLGKSDESRFTFGRPGGMMDQ